MSEETKPTACAHCGRKLELNAGFGMVKGETVCHPSIPDGPDCYRLITVYYEAIGSRMPVPVPGEKTCEPDEAEVEELRRYQDRAEAKIRELAREVADLSGQLTSLQRRTEILTAERDEHKKRLDTVCNEVFSITDSFPRPDAQAREYLYHLGIKEGLNQTRFAVLRGLGVFEPNHESYIPASRMEDLKLIRLAINDPGAFTKRQKLSGSDEEYENLGTWGARAVIIALREGRGDR
jgi:hypothetical protein